MTKQYVNEAVAEDLVLAWIESAGYQVVHGPDLGPDMPDAERKSFSDVVLEGRLAGAIDQLNPELPSKAVQDVVRSLLRVESQNLVEENYRFWRLIVDGVPVTYRDSGGVEVHGRARVIDFDDAAANQFLAVNQYTVVEDRHNRRPDIVIFVNGLPLAVFELKSPSDEKATLKAAWNQLQTYKSEIPSLFLHNAVLVVSDLFSAKAGSLTSTWGHFAPWKTIDDAKIVEGLPELEVLVRGMFDPARFLGIVRSHIAFTDEDEGLAKRLSKYHQYWAVRAAVDATVTASGEGGDGRAGVVWHTQGSGKSFEMLLYVSEIMRHPDMANPTVVMLTDRNDLDDQLFDEVFAPTRSLPETPVQAADRDNLVELLKRPSGGIVFTTIQKFSVREKGERFPLLTDRSNVVVVADEAHRSQYDFIDGFARHLRDGLPNATFIGFTGTPIDLDDRSTTQVFGDCIAVYDISRSVEDGATVRIFYESRLAKIELSDETKALLDERFDEVTEGEDEATQWKLKRKWSRLEAIVGAPERVELIAQDIVEHWEKRRDAMVGKGMIVAMSRRIAVDLYNAIVKLRPDWHSDKDNSGRIKVVMTGSASDPLEWQPHIRNKQRRRDLKKRAKNVNDALELVIVQGMWLTGFDSPSMHTMYVDKPMRGHNLMQAIARVNRVFRDKPGGLIVDYIGIATSLQDALSVYSEKDREAAGIDISEALRVLEEKYDIVCGILHQHDWSAAHSVNVSDRIMTIRSTADFVVADPDRKKRFMDQTLALRKAYALTATQAVARERLDDIAFFEAIRSQIAKVVGVRVEGGGEDIDAAINQIISDAITADTVIDLFDELGGDAEVSILSDDFLDSLADPPYPNLQALLLQRLLKDKVKSIARINVVQSRKFSEKLNEAILAYENRAMTTAQIIAHLVELAKEMRAESDRGEALGLGDAELAFYDAVVQNDVAVLELGDDRLKLIATELVRLLRDEVTIDWSVRDQVRAKIRTKVKRLLARYGYPPDKENAAVELVLEQTKLFADEWAAE